MRRGEDLLFIATRLSDNTTNPHKPNSLFRTCTGYNYKGDSELCKTGRESVYLKYTEQYFM